jgi:guanylate kinase
MKRITKAIEEIHTVEKYDYLVINDTISNAAVHIEAIIDAEKNRAFRNIKKIKYFIETFKEA